MRKVSIRTVEIAIGMARSMANGTTKWPFLGYCADLMAKMLEEIKETRKKSEFEGSVKTAVKSNTKVSNDGRGDDNNAMESKGRKS